MDPPITCRCPATGKSGRYEIYSWRFQIRLVNLMIPYLLIPYLLIPYLLIPYLLIPYLTIF